MARHPSSHGTGHRTGHKKSRKSSSGRRGKIVMSSYGPQKKLASMSMKRRAV